MTPGRLRWRRRLLLLSAPVVVVLLLAAIKMISVVVFGGAAVTDFAARDVGALHDDVSGLEVLNVIEPAKATFSHGDLAAIAGDLAEADARFADVLSRTAARDSCPVRINLELVRETQGDLAAKHSDPGDGLRRYKAALSVIDDAPAGCFQGNADPDEDRRAVRNDAAARVAQKIRALEALPVPIPPPVQQPPPLPPPPPPPPPPPLTLGVLDPDLLPGGGPDVQLRLQPGTGNPLDRLQEALGNSSAGGP